MKLWSVRQVLMLLLAVFVTTGMDLSAVRAGNMTAKMAMTSDMDVSGHDRCQGCLSGSGDDGMKAMACVAVCVTPLLAVLPQTAPVLAAQKRVSFAARYPLLYGRASPPDPYPPRSTVIG